MTTVHAPAGQQVPPWMRDAPPPISQAALAVIRFVTAVAIAGAIGLDLDLGHQLTSSTLMVLGSAPLWAPGFLRTRFGRILTAALGLFLAYGLMLAWVAESDHAVPRKAQLVAVLTYIGYVGGVGALIWAARVLGVGGMAGVYGVAMLAGAVLDRESWQDNPWKYAFAVPVTLIVLVVVDRIDWLALTAVALAGLGLVSVTNSYRSGLGMLVGTVALLVWQRVRRGSVREPSLAAVLVGLMVTAASLYYVGTRLLVSGLLGATLQARSQQEVADSGSLLLGGRPEWTVTIRLFTERPWGFGLGVKPASADFDRGLEGFASIHLLSQENYLRNYVFQDGFRLHSVFADLWVAGGFAGMLVAGVFVWILVGGLTSQLARRTTTAAQALLSLLALWNLGFGPTYTNMPEVVLALAVALSVQEFTRPGEADPGEADPDRPETDRVEADRVEAARGPTAWLARR